MVNWNENFLFLEKHISLPNDNLDALDSNLIDLYNKFYKICDQSIFIQMRQNNLIKRNDILEEKLKVCVLFFFYY